MKAKAYNYIHRKKKKGDFRSLWIIRINTAAKANGISYSKFIYGLKKAGCTLDRKALSELAIHHPESFADVATVAKNALAS